MKKLTVIITVFLASTGFAFAQKSTDDFTGKWKTEKGQTVTFSKTSGGFIAVAGEKKMVVIDNIRFTDDKWKGIIHSLKGDTLHCELLLKNGKLEVKAKKGIFTRTLEWTKA